MSQIRKTRSLSYFNETLTRLPRFTMHVLSKIVNLSCDLCDVSRAWEVNWREEVVLVTTVHLHRTPRYREIGHSRDRSHYSRHVESICRTSDVSRESRVTCRGRFFNSKRFSNLTSTLIAADARIFSSIPVKLYTFKN